MKHPIEARLPAVFVHVRDIRRAADFYARLLGLPVEAGTDFQNGIFVFALSNGVDLVLDANHAEWQRPTSDFSFHATCMFPTDDIDGAHAHLLAQGVEVVTEIQRDSSVAFFNFRDPDGNIHMVCATART